MGSSISRTQRRGPSGSAISADNSRGASVAAVELSGALNQALAEIDLDGNLNVKFQQLIQQLDQTASKYRNSKVSDDGSATDWNCPQAEAQLVSAAWKCARATYDLESIVADTAYCTFRKDHVLHHSRTGIVKALISIIVEPVDKPGTESDSLPVLVIAIRGSASKMDHIVNANSRPKATESFIQHPNFLKQPKLQAHSGFLNSSWALAKIVSERIEAYVAGTETQSERKPHVLFTGHSAGGAVASLFYLHYISNPNFSESARFSCVTFGAPPCVTAPVDLSLYQPGGPTLCLNIINEFDVVSRADKPYILSLVDLVRAKVDLPPEASGSATSENTIRAPNKAKLEHELESFPSIDTFLSDSDESFVLRNSDFWGLPRPFYHHVGSRVILMMRLDEGKLGLRVVEVPLSEFRKLLFCRIAVHFKARYGERVEMLESGRFNHQDGWEREPEEQDLKGKDML
ncbi:alpha beta-hydrolase [Fusarium albosuccineum]|uniref:Alpha beta-hydrolase n=1 Tax=Fusarium albosuccineum TaxID=1237068 RepID=A0A8H4PJ12_9HYPO|nr:alpha beta-hydrolase [Fusarium albosuccineum]